MKGSSGAMSEILDFENVKLNGVSGKLKIASGGIAFKSKTGEITTLKLEEIKDIYWQKCALEYQLSFIASRVFAFENIPKESFNQLEVFFQDTYSIALKSKDFSIKGWNWGQITVAENSLNFVSDKKPVFQIPMNQIRNTFTGVKNELAVELTQSSEKRQDSLVEIRFYVPPVEEEDMAAEMVQQIRTIARLDTLKGDIVASLTEIQCLTPRGRYEMNLTKKFFTFRGKTYDYKIPYNTIRHLFLLPKPDDVHLLFIVVLDPPIRQGQTSYPFLVFQFPRDEELQLDLSLDEEELKESFPNLQQSYSAPTFQVVSNLFKEIGNQKIIVPGSYKSYNSQCAVKCNQKANEGMLFILEKYFVFITKPCLLVPFREISSIVFSRTGSNSSSRNFDMKIVLNSGIEHVFSNMFKEEFGALEAFIKSKNIKYSHEAEEVVQQMNFDEMIGDDESSSDDEEYQDAEISDESTAESTASGSESNASESNASE